jgi:hypothetical protein
VQSLSVFPPRQTRRWRLTENVGELVLICAAFGFAALGALRQGDWKLIVGPNKEATWYGAFSPNVSVPFDKTRGPVEQCLPACLYNIKVRARCCSRARSRVWRRRRRRRR